MPYVGRVFSHKNPQKKQPPFSQTQSWCLFFFYRSAKILLVSKMSEDVSAS